MSQIDPLTGLPKELGVFEEIEKQTKSELKVYTTKKRFNKLVTIVEGLKGEELHNVAKELKHKLACGVIASLCDTHANCVLHNGRRPTQLFIPLMEVPKR